MYIWCFARLPDERNVKMLGTKPSISGNIKTAELASRNKGYEICFEQIII